MYHNISNRAFLEICIQVTYSLQPLTLIKACRICFMRSHFNRISLECRILSFPISSNFLPHSGIRSGWSYIAQTLCHNCVPSTTIIGLTSLLRQISLLINEQYEAGLCVWGLHNVRTAVSGYVEQTEDGLMVKICEILFRLPSRLLKMTLVVSAQ